MLIGVKVHKFLFYLSWVGIFKDIGRIMKELLVTVKFGIYRNLFLHD
jgi:hypothetical protein